MSFKTPMNEFTHYGSFFGVPVYVRDDADFTVAGRNAFYDWLLVWAVLPVFHAGLWFVSFLGLMDPDDFGYPIWIKGEIVKMQSERAGKEGEK